MNIQTLMDAVKERVERRWPGEPVYTNYLPNGFQRPSFALELQKDEWSELNFALIRRTVTLQLTGFVETDPYGDSAREELNRRMEAACALFAGGWIPVEDRSVWVRTVRGSGTPDVFEASLIFSWADARPAQPAGEVPLMGEYELNMTTKE